MKRILAISLAVITLLALCACGSTNEVSPTPTPDGYNTPEELVEAYLNAVIDKNYEVIWNMLPKEVQDYAIDTGIIKDKEDGLKRIEYAISVCDWLVDLNLANKESFDFEILYNQNDMFSFYDELDAETQKRAQDNLYDEYGLRIVLDGGGFGIVDIQTDDTYESWDCEFFKCDGKWYLFSITGDDTIFDWE